MSWMDDFAGWIDTGSGAVKSVAEAVNEITGKDKDSTSTGPITPQQAQQDVKTATESSPATLTTAGVPIWLVVAGLVAVILVLR